MIVESLLGALLAAIFTGGFVLWMWRSKFPPLPEWTWRNIMALIALLATIAGAAVLTAAAWWLLDNLLAMARTLIIELVKKDHTTSTEVGTALDTIITGIMWGLKLLLAGIIVVLLSLGIAITPRRIVLNKTGAELSGGDDSVPPVKVEVVNKPEAPVPVDGAPAMPDPSAPAMPEPGTQ
jgi:hypothetical protein